GGTAEPGARSRTDPGGPHTAHPRPVSGRDPRGGRGAGRARARRPSRPRGGHVKISAYWKSVIASRAPVLATVQAAADDGAFDSSEGITIAIALLIAFGVYRVPNKQA